LETTKRWDVEVGYRVTGCGSRVKNDEAGFALGWTHEEVLAEIASRYVSSYKDLPFAAYQIQTKFRNEPRAKSGLLRGREFIMKDLYSFHVSEEDLTRYYENVAEAYRKIFSRCGLKAIYTLAAGGAFTAGHTHEFQVISEVGEDTIFVCEKCGYAENGEISKFKDGSKCHKCGGKVYENKAIEVGNIFPLGTRYSEAFNLKFRGEDGRENYVVMGSYGIGLGRVMATVVEVSNNKDGIIWPESVAPFRAHLLDLSGHRKPEGLAMSKKLSAGASVYNTLQKAGVEVLYDDRELSAGEKFAEADLLGIPWRLVVSPKTGEGVEVKKRGEKTATVVRMPELLEKLSK
jgi:prolyl-tRNA synthetase